MRRFLLNARYAVGDFLGSGWWVLIIILLTVATPFALHQAGYRGAGPSVSEHCVRYSSIAESC